MFWKTLKMEFFRAMRFSRIILIIGLINLLLLGSDLNYLISAIKSSYDTSSGSIDMLHMLLGMDTFKTIMIVLLAVLHTGSFCKDDNSHYLRLILSRVDVTIFTQCRYLANLFATLITSILSFYVYIGIMSFLMPVISEQGLIHSYYYKDIASKYPLLYVGMCGVVFGLVAVACSSIGLLYSVYHSDSFVSIAISGLVFFWALSYIPYDTPFNMLIITGMGSSIGWNTSWPLMYLWTHLYMFSVIAVCGVLFYRRMKWRVKNGYV